MFDVNVIDWIHIGDVVNLFVIVECCMGVQFIGHAIN